MTELKEKKCIDACNATPLTSEELKTALLSLDRTWKIIDNGKRLERTFKFKDFYHTMGFVNAVAWMANQQNHHPDLSVGYNYCHVRYNTHTIDGISENDLICATNVDKIFTQ